nr:MAG TPA: hypothetical protein [Caudoviricetes sp.]
MVGSIIGAGIGALGSIFGGLSASSAMKQRRDGVLRLQQENKDWFDRRYNEDALQRADALALLERTKEAVRNRNQRAAGVQAVIGGTDESVAHEREAGNKAIADVTTNIAAEGARRKDQIEAQYRAQDAALQGQLNDIERDRANATSEAIKGVASAGANIAGLF